MDPEVERLMSLLAQICRTPEIFESKLAELRCMILSQCFTSSNNTQQLWQITLTLTAKILSLLKSSNLMPTTKNKFVIVDILKLLLNKTKVTTFPLFVTIFDFLLDELQDPQKLIIAPNISEDSKLSLIMAVKLLILPLPWDVAKYIYAHNFILPLSRIIYAVVELAKNERFKSLRTAAIELLMILAKVDDAADPNDLEMRNHVAEMFVHFLPGIAQGLNLIALEEETQGHYTAQLAIRAWSRVVGVVMQNYKAADDPIFQQDFLTVSDSTKVSLAAQSKWKTKEELDAYLQNMQRSPQWYKETDSKLASITCSYVKLTHYCNRNVRLELAQSCFMLIHLCPDTMPITISKLIELVIILMEDEDEEVVGLCEVFLSNFQNSMSANVSHYLLGNLEENFYTAVSGLPRIFNSLDENEQLSSLNLLVGYLKMFGKSFIEQMLHSASHLKRFIDTLIQFCELETKEVSLYEEYMVQDLDIVTNTNYPWKNFRYFRDLRIQNKIEVICALLAEFNVVNICADLLLNSFVNDEKYRKETTFLLNNILYGTSGDRAMENMHVITLVVNTYLDPQYWNLTLEVSHDCMMPQVKNNIVQICLQLEGLGKIALAIGGHFKHFLLKSLYPVLDRAGSKLELFKAAGIMAVTNISVACDYANMTELVSSNSDYFSFHVVRKLQRTEHNESVLNVLTMVMRFSTAEVLPSISTIINEVLLQTCDNFFKEINADAYLRVFQMFMKCIMRWMNITVEIGPIKSKLQRKLEHEEFLISNLNIQDCPDDKGDAEKTAEEMYKEDMEKKQRDQEEDFELPLEEAEEPKLPLHAQLTVAILQRCVHFLPCKDRSRKLLVLEILKDGLEILLPWENFLLPLVHQIWSPLVGRFKEKDELLIMNYSFQLLVTLARLSKDFIRSRTSNDVLPQIRKTLLELSISSYLKDAGSAYRYTQAYKLQLVILRNLGRVVTDIDLADSYIVDTMKALAPYLHNKQPIPLQEAAINSFCDIAAFDSELVKTFFHKEIYKEVAEDEKSAFEKCIQAVLKKIGSHS